MTRLTSLSERQKLIKEIARYMIVCNTSIRETAQEYDISKTTLHRWIYKELRFIDDDLFIQVKNKLKTRRK